MTIGGNKCLPEKCVGLVRRRGLEPLCLAAQAPQACASANFATSADACSRYLLYVCDVQSVVEYTICQSIQLHTGCGTMSLHKDSHTYKDRFYGSIMR